MQPFFFSLPPFSSPHPCFSFSFVRKNNNIVGLNGCKKRAFWPFSTQTAGDFTSLLSKIRLDVHVTLIKTKIRIIFDKKYQTDFTDMLYNVENNHYLILESIKLTSVINLKWCLKTTITKMLFCCRKLAPKC